MEVSFSRIRCRCLGTAFPAVLFLLAAACVAGCQPPAIDNDDAATERPTPNRAGVGAQDADEQPENQVTDFDEDFEEIVKGGG